MKVILHRKEEVDLDPKVIYDQHLKEQFTEPFIYHGKKYILREYKTISELFPKEPMLHVFLEEIK